MTLKQLEAFYWAATLGSFAAAADRLYITQSSLSKRISDLEDNLNCTLFDRSSRKSVLTDTGGLLLKSARDMLDLRESMHADLIQASQRGVLSGTCRFGISELSATTWFPSFVDRIRHTYPLLALEPRVGPTRELERQVERGELDFAVVAGSVTSEAVTSYVITQVPIGLVASPARARPNIILTTDEFQKQDLLTHAPDSGLAHMLNNWLANNSLQARRTIVCNSLTVITTLTVAGIGMSFLPMHYIQPLVNKGRLTALRSKLELPPLNYSFISHREDIRSMTTTMKDIVISAVDFSLPNPLWI